MDRSGDDDDDDAVAVPQGHVMYDEHDRGTGNGHSGARSIHNPLSPAAVQSTFAVRVVEIGAVRSTDS